LDAAWQGIRAGNWLSQRQAQALLSAPDISTLRGLFSVDAIYAWVRAGLIPDCCILRIGSSMRIESDQFDTLLRAGKLYRPRGRKAEEQARQPRPTAQEANGD
jgi:hypothetical protein